MHWIRWSALSAIAASTMIAEPVAARTRKASCISVEAGAFEKRGGESRKVLNLHNSCGQFVRLRFYNDRSEPDRPSGETMIEDGGSWKGTCGAGIGPMNCSDIHWIVCSVEGIVLGNGKVPPSVSTEIGATMGSTPSQKGSRSRTPKYSPAMTCGAANSPMMPASSHGSNLALIISEKFPYQVAAPTPTDNGLTTGTLDIVLVWEERMEELKANFKQYHRKWPSESFRVSHCVGEGWYAQAHVLKIGPLDGRQGWGWACGYSSRAAAEQEAVDQCEKRSRFDCKQSESALVKLKEGGVTFYDVFDFKIASDGSVSIPRKGSPRSTYFCCYAGDNLSELRQYPAEAARR